MQIVNHFGQRAEAAWKELDPQRYAEISNPNRFFWDLGRQAETYHEELVAEMTLPPGPAEETYLEKVGRINAIKAQAEEIVYNDVLMPPVARPSILEEEPEDPMNDGWVDGEEYFAKMERRRENPFEEMIEQVAQVYRQD